MDAAEVAERTELGRLAKTWRLVAAAVVLGVLAWTSAFGTDDAFPLGPLTQYSFRIDPNGEIRALWVEADLADGTTRRLDISSAADVGVNRAELEGQLDRIVADPARLQALADAWVSLHPERAPLRRIVVGQDVVELTDGARGGRRTDVFTTWVVLAPAPGE